MTASTAPAARLPLALIQLRQPNIQRAFKAGPPAAAP